MYMRKSLDIMTQITYFLLLLFNKGCSKFKYLAPKARGDMAVSRYRHYLYITGTIEPLASRSNLLGLLTNLHFYGPPWYPGFTWIWGLTC